MEPRPAHELFADSPRAELSQGDIVLAPTAVIWSPDRYHPDFNIPPPPQLGETVFVPAWDDYSNDGIPIPVVEARWSPVMIVSHDCEIDKEFNRERARMLKEGYTEDEASRIVADHRDELDKLIVVSPIIGYDELPEDQWEGIASGSRIGFFPIPPASVFNDEPFLVDLNQLATVDRLLLMRYEKLASLTDEAAGVLRFKVSESYASRGLALVAQLEAMVGHTIRHVELQGKSKKATVLTLHLSNGDQTAIEIRRPREDVIGAVTRMLKGHRDRPVDAR